MRTADGWAVSASARSAAAFRHGARRCLGWACRRVGGRGRRRLGSAGIVRDMGSGRGRGSAGRARCSPGLVLGQVQWAGALPLVPARKSRTRRRRARRRCHPSRRWTRRCRSSPDRRPACRTVRPQAAGRLSGREGDRTTLVATHGRRLTGRARRTLRVRRAPSRRSFRPRPDRVRVQGAKVQRGLATVSEVGAAAGDADWRTIRRCAP